MFITCVTPMFVLFKNQNQKLPVRDIIKQPKELVINTTTRPYKCNKGTLTISKDGTVLYSYLGEIQIINDGNDGNQIEVFIDYPYENLK